MTVRNPQQIREHYSAAMGLELGLQFAELWQEMARLSSRWTEYVDLFGQSDARVKLLNQTAPHFFGIAQDALWDQTLLHIARITDPPASVGKGRENLSIQNLPLLASDAGLKKELEAAIADALLKSSFCREWRNKRIAHNDLNQALNRAATPLKGASRLQVGAALEALEAVLNRVTLHYLESNVHFDMGSAPGGAESLLYTLRDGFEVESRRRDALMRGKVPDDGIPDPI